MEGGMAKSFFRLSNEGDKTKVKWGIMVETGANPLLRILGSFMDGFIGKDFERGLTKLKINTEKISFPIFEENSSVVNLK